MNYDINYPHYKLFGDLNLDTH